MKIFIIFSTVLLFLKISSLNASGVNCLWQGTTYASGTTFTITASTEALRRSYLSHSNSGDVCSTRIVDTSSNFQVYYELEVSTLIFVRTPDCIEGHSPLEYLHIASANASVSGNGIESCLEHLDRLVVQLPQRISYFSEITPETGFQIKFTRVSKPCISDKLEATATHKFLFSPLYESHYSAESISCTVTVRVPQKNVLFLQIRRSPSPSVHRCNGSLMVSGTSSDNQDIRELCGSGSKAMVLEPLNYREGISFKFGREANRYFSGFHLEYWAIQRVVKDCRNMTVDELFVSSEAVSYELQVTVEAIQRGYCDFYLTANGKTISLPYLSDVPRTLSVDIITDEGDFTKGCGFPDINSVRAPPRQAIRIRIRPCNLYPFSPNSLSSLIFVAVAEPTVSFPKVLFAANDETSYIWIPWKSLRERETFEIRTSDTACFEFSTKSPDGPKLSSVANLFSGIGTTSFDFSRDCRDKPHDETKLYSNTSDTVTVQIKSDKNEGFWLLFQVFTVGECPVLETELDPLHVEVGMFLPPFQEKWRENMQCKWILHASPNDILTYRGLNLNPEFVVLAVRNATTGQLITTFPTSASRGWYYATSDIEVYAHVSKSLKMEDSFDFQYDLTDFTEIETCSSRTTHVLGRPATVYSPNYPNYSFGSSQCGWLLRQQQADTLVSVKFTSLGAIPCGSKSYISITVHGITEKICDPAAVEENYHGDVLVLLVTSPDEPMPGFSFTFSFTRVNCLSTPIQLTAALYPKSISSPGYPSCYPPNLNCSWRITASAGMKIQVIIEALTLESSVGCGLDRLEIFDGRSATYPSLASLCGQNIPTEGGLISSSSELYMRFYSDSGHCYSGFNLTYQQIIFNNQGCSRDPITMYADTVSKNLESPGYPYAYPHNMQCSWLIRSSRDPLVEIYVNDINLEEHPACQFDFIEIYDGSTRYSRSLARLCRREHVFDLYTSTSDVVLIYFSSDSHSRGRGFQLSFRSKKKDEDDDDRSSKYSATGAIVGGNIAVILVIFSLVVGYLFILKRRRRLLQRHRRSSNTTSGANFNSRRPPSSVFVINPLILNTYNGGDSSSNEPPPYPGRTNAAYSEESDPGMLESPPEYSEIVDSHQTLQPPAYSADNSRGPVSNSDDQASSPNSAEAPNVENDQRGPVEVDSNRNDGEEYVELQDLPPEYELARQIQDEPPPAYESRSNTPQQRRRLGPF